MKALPSIRRRARPSHKHNKIPQPEARAQEFHKCWFQIPPALANPRLAVRIGQRNADAARCCVAKTKISPSRHYRGQSRSQHNDKRHDGRDSRLFHRRQGYGYGHYRRAQASAAARARIRRTKVMNRTQIRMPGDLSNPRLRDWRVPRRCAGNFGASLIIGCDWLISGISSACRRFGAYELWGPAIDFVHRISSHSGHDRGKRASFSDKIALNQEDMERFLSRIRHASRSRDHG